jgi:hypothetical protein
VRATLVCLAILAPVSLSAQDSTPQSPFHRGDWEAGAAVGANLTLGDLALLKYTSPTSAWYFGGSFSAVKVGVPNGVSTSAATGYQVSLTIARRFFRVVAPRTALFLSPNIVLGAGHFTCSGCNQSTGSFAIGADVGGEFFITSFAGIGVAAGVNAGYSRVRTTVPAGSGTSSLWSATVHTPAGIFAFLHL